MNYITHLNKAFAIICEDERLTPFHVSLYFSLFQYWNMARFRNPISISRDELMRSSKIGSVNTYIRCIKELDKWQYIKYIPSFNPQKGSQVYLYNFNNSNNNASDISNNKGSDKTSKKTTGKAGETQVIPSINNTNKPNNSNKLKENEHKRTRNNRKSSDSSGGGIKKEKSSAKKERSNNGTSKSEKPTIIQVKTHFATKQWPTTEAEKFFNYFQSNGWLVGGKTPMKDWKAAANNWMLNSEKFNHVKTKNGSVVTSSGVEKRSAGKLNATTEKNYNEPL